MDPYNSLLLQQQSTYCPRCFAVVISQLSFRSRRFSASSFSSLVVFQPRRFPASSFSSLVLSFAVGNVSSIRVAIATYALAPDAILPT